MLMMSIFGVGAAFLAAQAMRKSSADLALARDQRTQIALERAKQALLAYVTTVYAENAMSSHSHGPNKGVPGYFPCPDLGPSVLPRQEGRAALVCGEALVSALGKLPWATLGVEPLQDGSGECLWYAVSGTYKYHPNGVNTNPDTSNMMNWDTPGLFDVVATEGTSLLAGGDMRSRVVAVILAPGAALAGQDRSGAVNAPGCGGSYRADAYLESTHGLGNGVVSLQASEVTSFVSGRQSGGATPPVFNDRLVYITRDEVWSAIKKRPDFHTKLSSLTRKVALCLAYYGTQNRAYPADKRLPWAGRMSLSNYAVDGRYRDGDGNLSGRAPYRVSASDADTSNSIVSPFQLFGEDERRYCSDPAVKIFSDDDINWYSNWKDHLFYAVSRAFGPSASPATGPCASSCLRVNGEGTYAGIVFFAGERLNGQARESDADRANIANYLDRNNARNHPNASGNSDYQAAAATSAFNDELYCIRPDLSVEACHDMQR